QVLEHVAEDHRVEAAALAGQLGQRFEVGLVGGVESLGSAGGGFGRELEAGHLDFALLLERGAEGAGAAADVEDTARPGRDQGAQLGPVEFEVLLALRAHAGLPAGATFAAPGTSPGCLRRNASWSSRTVRSIQARSSGSSLATVTERPWRIRDSRT